MNRTNSFGFIAVGFILCLAPLLAPGLFPHTALDGSSTRALWVEVMGAVQVGVGLICWLKDWMTTAVRNTAPADAPGAWGTAANDSVLVVERVETPEPEGSVTLHGEHAELWLAFNHALRNDGHARQLAARLVAVAQAAAVPEAENVIPFAPADSGEEREAVASDRAA